MRKTVLVTDATKGMGLGTSHHFAAVGYKVIGIVRNSIAELPGTLFPCNLSNQQETADTIQGIREQYTIDAIINNVGIANPEPLGSISLSSLDNVYDLSVRVAVEIVQGLIDCMKEKSWGPHCRHLFSCNSRGNKSHFLCSSCSIFTLRRYRVYNRTNFTYRWRF